MRKYRLVLPESIAKEKARLAELKKKKKAREAAKRAEKRKRERLREKERLKKIKQKEKEKEREKKRKEKEKQKKHEAALKRKRKRENAWHRKKYQERKRAYFHEHKSEIISEKTKQALLRKKKKKAYEKEYNEARRNAASVERISLKDKKEKEKKLKEKKIRKKKVNKRYHKKVKLKKRLREYNQKYYYEHKGKATYEKHILTNDISGKFRIAIAKNGVVKKTLTTKKWWSDVTEKWEELVKENHKDVLCPVTEHTNHHGNIITFKEINEEILLLKKINPEHEENISVFRDETGKIVKVKTDNEAWTVISKEPWYKEEKFIVNGMNPVREKKTGHWICENIIEKGLSQNNLKKILLWKNYLIIDGDNDFNFCIAKTATTATNLYIALFNKYSEADYVYFIGELHQTQYEKWRNKIMDKTGWDRAKLLLTFKGKSRYGVASADSSNDIPTKSNSTKSVSGKSSGKR
jgi:hypothetical protein